MIRVLIADDQRINRVLLGRLLDRDRYVVFEAEDGAEAVEMFVRERPDVVLLDAMMPRVDGFQAARMMKAAAGDEHVPIIMVTALSDEASLKKGMEAGADDFVPKPFNRQVLESKMRAALRTRSAFAALSEKRAQVEALHARSLEEQVVAERLMASLIKSPSLDHPMFRYRSRPLDVFNGDLLLAAPGPEGRMRLLLGDFSGHGLVAAIGGLPVVAQFQRMCAEFQHIDDLAAAAHAALRVVLPRDRFLALVLLDIDPSRGEVSVLNAGMPPVLVRGPQGQIRASVPSNHLPLGVLDRFDARGPVPVLSLRPGERMYLFSDGVVEAERPDGTPFGDERLFAEIAAKRAPNAVFDAALAELDRFVAGAEPGDDVTLLELDVHADARPVEAASAMGSVASLRLVYGPDGLRGGDPLRTVEGMLDALPGLEGRRVEVFAVAAELVNNAIDHGVLGLESASKTDPDSFCAFYEDRARRLEALDRGRVELSIRVEKSGPRALVDIEVTDSGPGFDVSVSADRGEGFEMHGRGLEMVRSISQTLEFSPRGNRVHARCSFEEDRSGESAADPGQVVSGVEGGGEAGFEPPELLGEREAPRP